jgi:hypothetical protein
MFSCPAGMAVISSGGEKAMNNKENLEISSQGHQEKQPPLLHCTRTPEEIQERIKELEFRIKGHDVWIHTAHASVPEPNAWRKKELYEAKLSEIRWILGEDILVTEGIIP